ncbi:MAG: Uma2 family endonuclease [Bryobacterales bacterium]|nr:Uma2 family endonuclease [Bryobacterales bacterium]
MIASAIIHDGDPVELLEGVLVKKARKSPAHRFATYKTRKLCERLASTGRYVDSHAPITLGSSEPEPDVAIIHGEYRDYTDRHPGPGDIALVVEIADATLDRDRILKRRIYASAGIPVYWVLDLNRRRLEVFSDPKGDNYSRCTMYESHQRIEVVLDGSPAGTILLSDLLP